MQFTLSFYLHLLLPLTLFPYANLKAQTKVQLPMPLQDPSHQISSFGELRSGHFHAGIDLGTYRQIGKPLHSPADGYVSRIKVSPTGYGLALYINHPLKRITTVYGHLSRFTPEIDAFVKRVQYRNKRFPLDTTFYFKKFHFKKGEILGYSGNSGYSFGPHLHFEVREMETQIPLNPASFGVSIQDEIAPRLQTLFIYQLDRHGSIQKKDEYPLKLQNNNNGHPLYHPPQDTLIVYPKTGIGLIGYDLVDAVRRKMGLYKLSLWVNKKKIFSFTMDKLPFNETRYINSFTDYSERLFNRRAVYKLFRDEGNRMTTAYDSPIRQSTLMMKPNEIKKITITASDYSNNQATSTFYIKAVEPTPQNTWTLPRNFFRHNRNSTWQQESVEFHAPTGTFYHNFVPSILWKNDTLFMLPEEIPMHKYGKVTLPVPNSLPDSLLPKLLLLNICNNKISYHLGRIEQKDFISLVRSFGKYTIDIDTTPPTIQLRYLRRSKVLFKITDNKAGITSYNGYIDGKWALFELSKKDNSLIYRFDYTRIPRKKSYQIKIIATDGVGNKTTYLQTVYFKR